METFYSSHGLVFLTNWSIIQILTFLKLEIIFNRFVFGGEASGDVLVDASSDNDVISVDEAGQAQSFD